MKKTLFIFALILSSVQAQFCIPDYTVTADSSSEPVDFLLGLTNRSCFESACGPFAIAEIVVRIDSDSLPNHVEFTGFQGDVSVQILDTNCSFRVFDTCFYDVGEMDTSYFETYTGYHCFMLVTIHMQQPLVYPRISARSLPTASPGVIELCPVGIAEPCVPQPRNPLLKACMGMMYVDMLGRGYEKPPCGIILYDVAKDVFTIKECP
jgi:hypothetical protein